MEANASFSNEAMSGFSNHPAWPTKSWTVSLEDIQQKNKK